MISFRGLLAWGISLLLTCQSVAQQPAAPQAPVRIATSEVLLDVLVHDKKGRPVRDLRPDELEVYEDGVKQPVSKFTLVGTPPADAKKNASPEAGPEAPIKQQSLNLVTILFDHLPAVRVQPVRDAGYLFVDTSITDNMLVRVMVVGKRMYVVEQFTNDRAELRKAIERATSTLEKSHAERSDQIAEELKQKAGGEEALTTEARLARITLETLAASEKLAREVKNQLHVFPLLPFSRAHRHVPGRKMALYFSDGLYLPPGFNEVLRAVISEANLANVSFYTINIRNLLVGAGNQSSRIETGTVINATRRPETAGFSTDNANSFSARRVSDQPRTNFNTFEVIERNKELNKRSPLSELTEGTGGFQFTTSNELNGTLKRVAQEIGNYYALSYVPLRHEYDGKFRAITVKSTRPGVRIQTRNGYFALPLTGANSRPAVAFEAPLLAALNGAVVPHDFPFKSGTLHFDARSNESHSVALAEIPLENFIHEPEENGRLYPVRFAVMLMVKDEKGEVKYAFSEPHEMEVPAAMVEDARQSSLTMTRHFWLPPGRYTLEAAAHDQKTNKLSAQRQRFTIGPIAPGLHTGSFFLIREIEQIDPSTNNDSENPLIFGDKHIIPEIDNTISPSARKDLSFHLAIYPDANSAEKSLLKLELLRDGKPIATTSPTLPKADANGRITFAAGLNISAFPPGEYQFRAQVKQGSAIAERFNTFSIVGTRTSEPVAEEKTITSSLSASDTVSELALTALKTVRPLELSPQDLIEVVKKAGARMFAGLGDYTYSLRKVRRSLTPKGKIRNEIYEDYEAYPVRGKHALIQLAENGSQLSTVRIDLNRRHATEMLIKSDAEMQAKSEQEEAELNKKIGYWGASLEGQYQKRGQPRRNIFITIDPEILFSACEFSGPRSVLLEGRETIVMDFHPLAGVALDQDKDWLGRLTGTVWIDALEKSLVRIEGQGVMNEQFQNDSLQPPLNFVYQQQRLADGVWAPSLIRINSAGDENLFHGLNWDAWFQFTNFKRFDARDSDVKIVSPREPSQPK
jgi:VWFA-related protein